MPQLQSLLKIHMYKSALTTDCDFIVLPRFFSIIYSVVLIFIFATVIPVFPHDSFMVCYKKCYINEVMIIKLINYSINPEALLHIRVAAF